MNAIGERALDALKSVERADLAVTEAVAGDRHRAEVQRAGKWSEVADQPPLVALSAGVLAIGLATRSRGVARTGFRMLAAHALATGIKTAIKRSIDRTRPDHALIAGYRMAPGNSDEHELSSFPSGHTAGAVAVAEAVAREAPILAAPMRLLAGAVGIVQVPRCKHYVSDVLIGAAIGLLAERMVAATMARAGDIDSI
jgi:membrane-associated phospholipid phosphatase